MGREVIILFIMALAQVEAPTKFQAHTYTLHCDNINSTTTAPNPNGLIRLSVHIMNDDHINGNCLSYIKNATNVRLMNINVQRFRYHLTKILKGKYELSSLSIVSSDIINFPLPLLDNTPKLKSLILDNNKHLRNITGKTDARIIRIKARNTPHLKGVDLPKTIEEIDITNSSIGCNKLFLNEGIKCIDTDASAHSNTDESTTVDLPKEIPNNDIVNSSDNNRIRHVLAIVAIVIVIATIAIIGLFFWRRHRVCVRTDLLTDDDNL